MGWGWHVAMRVRELAMEEARLTCASQQVQWLDESVELRSMGLERDAEGRLGVRRMYGFRYLEGGDRIREGAVLLHGLRVQMVMLDRGQDFS